MKITKILAVLLVMCLMLVMLVSCKDEEEENYDIGTKGKNYGDNYPNQDVGGDDEISETFSQGLQFEVSEDRTYFIVKDMGTCTDTKVVVPSTYNGLPVKELGYGAFGGGSMVKPNVPRVSEVILPNSIVKIGNGAFANNSYLTKIKFGNSVESIDSDAFYNCDNIKEVHIPSIKKWCSIDFYASDSCPFNSSPNAKLYVNNKQVTDLVIDGISEIKNYAFSGCGTIETLSVGSNVKTIGKGAFYNCDKLSNVSIGASVTKIDSGIVNNSAFANCDILLSVKFADTSGWTVYNTIDGESVEISSTELSNVNTAAKYVENTYSYYIWIKK